MQEERHLTYGALNAEANRLARYLRGLGRGRSEGSDSARSQPGAGVSELAILKCGAAYAPLDQNSRRANCQAFMIEDCQAGLS